MNYYLGVDIGSVNAKLLLIDESGSIIRTGTERITVNPKVAVNSLLAGLGEKFKLEEIVAVDVSGSGKAVVPREFGWAEYSGSLSNPGNGTQQVSRVNLDIQLFDSS